MYCAFCICALFLTEGFIKACLARSWRIVPVLSNLRLKRFSALSIFSPSFTGIINIVSSPPLFKSAKISKISIVSQIFEEKSKIFLDEQEKTCLPNLQYQI